MSPRKRRKPRMKGGVHEVGQATRLKRNPKGPTESELVRDLDRTLRERYDSGDIDKDLYQHLRDQKDDPNQPSQEEAYETERLARDRDIPKKRRIRRNKPAKKKVIPRNNPPEGSDFDRFFD